MAINEEMTTDNEEKLKISTNMGFIEYFVNNHEEIDIEETPKQIPIHKLSYISHCIKL